MVMAVVGECVIYQAILREANKAVEGGQRPVAVRLNAASHAKLKEEHGGLMRSNRGSYGNKITVLESPHGPLLLVYDKHMPDDAVIVLCAIPTFTVFPKGDEDV